MRQRKTRRGETKKTLTNTQNGRGENKGKNKTMRKMREKGNQNTPQ